MNNEVFLKSIYGDIDDAFINKCIPNIDDVLSTLKTKEAFIINRTCGTSITFSSLAKEMGYSRGYIQALYHDGLRKIRYSKNRLLLLQGQISLATYVNIPRAELDRRTKEYYDVLDKFGHMKIEDLELSVRSFNCCNRSGIQTIRDLVMERDSNKLIKIQNLGRKSLAEIEDILSDLGLANPRFKIG